MVKMQNMVGEALAEDKKAPLKCWNIMNDHWIYIYTHTHIMTAFITAMVYALFAC